MNKITVQDIISLLEQEKYAEAEEMIIKVSSEENSSLEKGAFYTELSLAMVKVQNEIAKEKIALVDEALERLKEFDVEKKKTVKEIDISIARAKLKS